MRIMVSKSELMMCFRLSTFRNSMKIISFKSVFVILNIFTPLFIGALIYYLSSPDVIFVIAIDSLLFGKRIFGSYEELFELLRYYLCDMLWGYSLVFALYLAVGNNLKTLKDAFIIAMFFSCIIEALQLTPIIPGSFDYLDIFVEVVAEVFAGYIIKKYEEARIYA